jgi:L,D-transpeptidase-like protein
MRDLDGKPAVMRFILKFLLALGVLVAAENQASALVRVDIDLTSQTMHVRSGSGETYVWAISSGRVGHLTPRGVFRPRALYLMVHSAKYGNAPMPHSIFFYGQFAIHGTNAVGALGRPASHGCIRLSPQHAAMLFAMVRSQGSVIQIGGSTPASVARAQLGRDALSALAYAPIHRSNTLDEWARGR